MSEDLIYEQVAFFDDQTELGVDLEAKRRQDDPDIDPEGLRRQQLENPAVGVTVDVAHAEHPDALQARTHVVGPARRRKVGYAKVGEEEVHVYGLAQVDLVAGIRSNTGDQAAIPTRVIPDEFHAGDLPQATLAEALAVEDLAETATGRAINQARKSKTTKGFYPIR